MFSTIPYGFLSSKYRTVRAPLAVGFALFTAALSEQAFAYEHTRSLTQSHFA